VEFKEQVITTVLQIVEEAPQEAKVYPSPELFTKVQKYVEYLAQQLQLPPQTVTLVVALVVTYTKLHRAIQAQPTLEPMLRQTIEQLTVSKATLMGNYIPKEEVQESDSVPETPTQQLVSEPLDTPEQSVQQSEEEMVGTAPVFLDKNPNGSSQETSVSVIKDSNELSQLTSVSQDNQESSTGFVSMSGTSMFPDT
jgi:hypothetical protein